MLKHVKIVLEALHEINMYGKKKILENSPIVTGLARQGVRISIRALG